MKKIVYILTLLVVCFATSCTKLTSAQKSGMALSEQDLINIAIYDSIYDLVKDDSGVPIQELVIEIAEHFLGTPYVASTLERTPEQLRVYLNKTDCILFVELCTSFALTVKGLRLGQLGDGEEFFLNPKPFVKRADPSYRLLCDNIRNMRYRLGVVDGYSSRIHYTSEWILQNQTNGVLYEYTKEYGERYTQHFNFMSTHAGNYKQLSDTAQLRRIREMERHLEEQKPFYYIPQRTLRNPKVMAQIETGDIICFVAKQGNGIDIAHVGLAYEYGGEMHFLHASYGSKEVVIERQTLADYATNGIRVMRINPTLSNYIAPKH